MMMRLGSNPREETSEQRREKFILTINRFKTTLKQKKRKKKLKD